MSEACPDYNECRDHILGFYSDRYALLKKLGGEVDDAYDYFQDFLREGLKDEASGGLFWPGFALALHLIPGGPVYAGFHKALSVVKDSQPVFANADKLRSRQQVPRGNPDSYEIEKHKEAVEERIARLQDLVEVADQRTSHRYGPEVQNALAYLDELVEKQERQKVCRPLLPTIKLDIGERLETGWHSRLNKLDLDSKFAEMLIVLYVRDNVVAGYLHNKTYLDGINENQEKYIYDRADKYVSNVSDADQMVRQWGLATKITTSVEPGGDGVVTHNPPKIRPKSNEIPFIEDLKS